MDGWLFQSTPTYDAEQAIWEMKVKFEHIGARVKFEEKQLCDVSLVNFSPLIICSGNVDGGGRKLVLLNHTFLEKLETGSEACCLLSICFESNQSGLSQRFTKIVTRSNCSKIVTSGHPVWFLIIPRSY